MRIKRLLVIFCVCLYGLGFADTVTNNPILNNKIPVVVSFSVLSDVVAQIGGDKISITTLVGANQDIHDYELKPSDLTIINQSKGLFINGMGLEAGFINNIIKTYNGKVIVVSSGITPLKVDSSSEIKIDPHIWSNPNNVVKYYIPNILNGLIGLSPQNKAYFTERANQYKKQLIGLNQWIMKEFAAIPKDKRQAVTTHDAFNYFAKQYGVKFLYANGISTDSEATARDISNLERLINLSKVKVVFLENMTNNKLIEQVAKDTGATLGGRLYSDALSTTNEPANNYINMIRYNVDTLIKAWR